MTAADRLTPENYDYARGLTRSMGLLPRLAAFALLFVNALVLWSVLPGMIGTVVGGAMGALVAIMVLGEAWRQIQIHVFGLDGGGS